MTGLARDLRYALRALAQAPGVTVLAIVCLGLGIGVNGTVFSVADTVLLRPLPFDAPDRLVALYSTQLSNGIDQGAVSYTDYRDWAEQVRSSRISRRSRAAACRSPTAAHPSDSSARRSPGISSRSSASTRCSAATSPRKTTVSGRRPSSS